MAAKQLDESLRRLQTDHIDLVQFHEVIRMNDPERIFAPGGGMEATVKARDAGKVRFIGFTGHKSPQIHKQMLEVSDQHQFKFDAVQMPLNVMDSQYESFARIVLPMLQERKIGVLGMNPLREPLSHLRGTLMPDGLPDMEPEPPEPCIVHGTRAGEDHRRARTNSILRCWASERSHWHKQHQYNYNNCETTESTFHNGSSFMIHPTL